MPPTVAVIGAGIAGLATAYRLRTEMGDQVDIVVMDADQNVGGKLRTTTLAGRPVDIGAEAFVVRNPSALRLVDELGLTDRLIHPELSAPSIHAGGRTVPLPGRTFLGIPAEPEKLHGVLSPDGVARAVAEQDLPPLELPADPEAPDLPVGKVLAERFGRELVDRLVEPMLGGVYAGRADQLGLRATMPALTGRTTSLTHAVRQIMPPADAPRPPVFGALRGGMTELISALRQQARIRLGGWVTGLDRVGDHWELKTDTETLRADAVVVTTHAPAARDLLARAAPAVSANFGRVEYASVSVMTLALPPDAELPQSSGVLIGVGERHADGTPFTAKAFTFSSRKWGHQPGDPVMLRASIGRFREPYRWQDGDEEELLAAVRADLAELTGVTTTPMDWRLDRWGTALPQYGVEHTAAIAAIEREVAAVPGLAVAGAVLHGVGIPACIDGANAAAASIKVYLASRSGEIVALTGLVSE